MTGMTTADFAHESGPPPPYKLAASRARGGEPSILRGLTHLPVVVDPSHAAGRRDLVEPLAMAAAAVGADGIVVEVHPDPDAAPCDGPQTLVLDDFARFAARVEQAAALNGKQLGVPVG